MIFFQLMWALRLLNLLSATSILFSLIGTAIMQSGTLCVLGVIQVEKTQQTPEYFCKSHVSIGLFWYKGG